MTTPKVAVVTGAASGIGLGVARAAAARGYVVVMTDVHADRLAEAADDLSRAGASVLAAPADVSLYESLVKVATAAHDAFGRVDLLINNAGIEATGYLWEMDPAAWGRVIDVNIKGVVHGLRAFVPMMLEQSSKSMIVNVASLASLASGPSRQTAYNASKHAVLGLSECLKIELDEVRANISVHVLLPGPVSSRIFLDAHANGESATSYQEELHRFVTDEGVTGDEAAAMLFDGLDEGRFWITTHESMFETFAHRRAELLTKRAFPQPVVIST